MQLDVFGLVTAERRSLSITQSSLEVEEVSSTAHVQLESEELRYDDVLDGPKDSHVSIDV